MEMERRRLVFPVGLISAGALPTPLQCSCGSPGRFPRSGSGVPRSRVNAIDGFLNRHHKNVDLLCVSMVNCRFTNESANTSSLVRCLNSWRILSFLNHHHPVVGSLLGTLIFLLLAIVQAFRQKLSHCFVDFVRPHWTLAPSTSVVQRRLKKEKKKGSLFSSLLN